MSLYFSRRARACCAQAFIASRRPFLSTACPTLAVLIGPEIQRSFLMVGEVWHALAKAMQKRNIGICGPTRLVWS